MHWIYAFSLMPQFSTENSRRNFLKIWFPQAEKGEEKNYELLKIKSENMKMTWNIKLFIFSWFVIFLNMRAL